MAKTAGYSGTALPKKLGIREGDRVAWVNAPADFDRTIGTLPDDVMVSRGLGRGAPLDVIVRFVSSRAELARIDATWSGLRCVWRVENRPKAKR